jgi:hydrogenase maturation protease
MLLVVAIGNPWRRDDGAAAHLAGLIEGHSGIHIECVQQVVPELAADLAAYSAVVFADADRAPGEARLEPVAPAPPAEWQWTHSLDPASLTFLARRLYGFAGQAWLCRIPAEDFGEGEGLSPLAEASAARAAELVRELAAGQR